MTKYLDEQGLNTLWAKTKKTIKTNIDNIQIPEQITTATVDVDNNVGTPSATASVVGNTISFDFKNLKGENGDNVNVESIPDDYINALDESL